MDFIIPEREAKGLASLWRMGQKAPLSAHLTLSLAKQARLGEISMPRRNLHPFSFFCDWSVWDSRLTGAVLQTSFSKLAVSWFLVPELDEPNWYFTEYYLGMCILLWFPLFYLCYKLNAVWYWVLVNVWWYQNCQCLREWRVVKSHYKVVLWTYFYPQKFHP